MQVYIGMICQLAHIFMKNVPWQCFALCAIQMLVSCQYRSLSCRCSTLRQMIQCTHGFKTSACICHTHTHTRVRAHTYSCTHMYMHAHAHTEGRYSYLESVKRLGQHVSILPDGASREHWDWPAWAVHPNFACLTLASSRMVTGI